MQRYMFITVVAVYACLTQGCAKQTTLDNKVYRVASASGVNYYRVRITSSGQLGKTEYKAGYYPAFAVSDFLGAQSSEPQNPDETEQQLRKTIADAQVAALKKYVQAVQEDDEEERKDAARALLALQTVPVARPHPGENRSDDGQSVLQLNPMESLLDYTANKKLVIALSNNPDAILGWIAGFAEEPKTREAVLSGLGGLFAATSLPDQIQLARTETKVRSTAERLKELADKLGGEPPINITAARTEAELLLKEFQ